jgi:hypothetical protein
MPKTVGSIVKIVKNKHEVVNILPQCLDAHVSFVFIELSNLTSSDDLTFGGSLMRLPIASSQCFAS